MYFKHQVQVLLDALVWGHQHTPVGKRTNPGDTLSGVSCGNPITKRVWEKSHNPIRPHPHDYTGFTGVFLP